MSFKRMNAPIKLFLLLILLGLGFVSFSDRISLNSFNFIESTPSGDSLNTENPMLKVQGKKVIDSEGNEVYLRGFQGIGFYPIPDLLHIKGLHDKNIDPYLFDKVASDLSQYTYTDFDINEIKKTNANVVRLWVRLHQIQKEPYEYSETALEMLEDRINFFGENGIYVIPVLAGLGQNNYDDEELEYKPYGIDLFNHKTDTMNQAVALWGVLANKLKDNPYVAGYDVVNEPMPPTKDDLHEFYTKTIKEIRKYDPNHIIILAVAEKNEENIQIGGDYDDKNIMATFHFYVPHDFTLEPDIQGLTYPGTYNGNYWDKDAIEKVFNYALSLEELKDKPVYIGEFGADGTRDGNGGLEWITDVTEIMNKNKLHYTYHNYRHKVHYGYWKQKPDVYRKINEAVYKLVNRQLEYKDLTPEQKSILQTEGNYIKRPGIENVLFNAFSYSENLNNEE